MSDNSINKIRSRLLQIHQATNVLLDMRGNINYSKLEDIEKLMVKTLKHIKNIKSK